ncbi:MAG: hypothetical protein ACJ8DI_01515, partial [Ktedonobacteraceae bacterium]
TDLSCTSPIMHFDKFIRPVVGTLSGGQVTDLSCAPPHCISHKRGIAETWDPAWGAGNNAFQVPIYRPTRTLLCILAILLIVIIGLDAHPRISRMRRLGGHPMQVRHSHRGIQTR